MTTSASETVGGRYDIVRTLGQGAFGHTFLARDRQANRDVAVKVLDARNRGDAKAFELFRREAEVLPAVRHHGIPEVYDSFQDQWYGAPAAFLVMEYVEGDSLAKIIEEKRTLERAEVVHLFLELLGVLDYLHGRVPPILHRDLKPSNIIVRPNGFPALVDFGSVRRVFLGPDESGSTIAGTYGYMPYEQYMGQAAPASDLFALAATFLHLLTGRPPKDFMNDEGRISVPDALPGEPRLRAALARMLRSSPTERFASARGARDALVGPAALVAPNNAGPLPARRGPGQLARSSELLGALPPAPRELSGKTKELMRDSTPSAMRLMTASEKSDEDWGIGDYANLAFFSLVTAGILPIVFANLARARRRRVRRFFRDGEPGSAEVLRIELETTAFDEKLARVTYQFEADGEYRRDSDVVLPTIADRMGPGDRVPILYLRDRDFDSIIVAVE